MLSTAKAAQRSALRIEKSCAGSYKFGFNGQEKVNEIAGIGNSLDFGERMYDSRIARFTSRDPLSGKFPYYSPYQFAGNKPIVAIDLDGLEEFYAIDGRLIGAGNPDDKRKMMVLSIEKAKDVKNRNAAVEALMRQLDNQAWDIVTAPTPAAITMMEEAYKNGDKQEYGFVTGLNSAGEIGLSSLIPGDVNGVDLTAGINELRESGYTPLSGNHLHATGYTVDLNSTFEPLSSPYPSFPGQSSSEEHNDIGIQAERSSKGIFKESSVVMGLRYEIVEKFAPPGSRTFGGSQQEVKRTKVVTYYGDTKEKQKTINFSTLKAASQRIYGK